jgi:hypothetical protein
VSFVGGEDANCVLTGSTLTGADNGIYCTEAAPTIVNCVVTGHKEAGIKLINGSSPTIKNCIIAGNSGAGIELPPERTGRVTYYNYPNIVSCTVVSNGLEGVVGEIPDITNSIIYRNNRGNGGAQIVSDAGTVTYSDIQGGCQGDGNIDADPCFVKPGCWADGGDPNILVEPDDPRATWVMGEYHLR